MASDFFRKERPEVFKTRFTEPTAQENFWQLKSSVIFQAKAYPSGRKMTVKVGGVNVEVQCTVDFNKLTFQQVGKSAKVTVEESEIAGLIAERTDSTKSNTIKHQAILFLCKNHATSSANSPLISGTIVDNFKASSTYEGHKLHLKLKTRTPFGNPFASGLEKEYFLVGQVKDSDCEAIDYFGKTDENFNKLVNPFGSKIPRPA